MNKAIIFIFLFGIISAKSEAICFADSNKIKKNIVQLDILGAGNLAKISYSRNFYLNNKLIIAPRIGFSTIGVDFKALGKKRCEFVIGFRFLFIAVVPIGLPIQHQKSFYNRYEGKYETTSFLPSATATNYVGINYHFKSFFINGNVAIHSLVVDRDDKFGNDLFSSGIGFGYKF